MIQATRGKLTGKDEKFAKILGWIPWLALLLISLPLPLLLFALFLTSATTEAAAINLLLAGVALGLGLVVGLVVLILLQLYRKRWLSRLRDKLAADGITASELTWFRQELTTAERKALRETSQQNPLLGDAYGETLAARLTASRLIARTNQELTKIRARTIRARNLTGAEVTQLLSDLESDKQSLERLKGEANVRLLEARARLQTIEAAASRNFDQDESYSMLRRLSAAQDQLPLALEIEQLERRTLQEAEHQIQDRESPSDTSSSSALKT